METEEEGLATSFARPFLTTSCLTTRKHASERRLRTLVARAAPSRLAIITKLPILAAPLIPGWDVVPNTWRASPVPRFPADDVENSESAPSQGAPSQRAASPKENTMAKYLLLRHYRGAPVPVNDVPMDQWRPDEVEAHIRFMNDFAARLERRRIDRPP